MSAKYAGLLCERLENISNGDKKTFMIEERNMTTQEFIQELDRLFAEQEYDKVEPFMLQALAEAKEREDYGLYLSVGNEMIGYYRSVSKFQKAYQISEDMLLLMEELQMDQSAEFATVLLNTATAYSFDDNYEMALQFYRRAEQIYHLLVSPDDYLFAGLYNNMSSLMEKMGKNEEALELLMKALGILQNYPERQMEAATNFTNLGLLYLKMGDHESGKKCVMQAINMFEALDTPASHYSAALSALGEIFYHGKEYALSILWYQKALDEIEKHYGLNLAYAIVCENLAKVYQEWGDPQKAEEAEKYLRKAERVRADLKRGNRDHSLEQEEKADSVKSSEDADSRERAGNTENVEHVREAEKAESCESGEMVEAAEHIRRSGIREVTESTESPEKIWNQEKGLNADKPEKMSGISQKALARCREYYEKYGKPMLAQFPELQGHYAAGLTGEGSECFGYDDVISTDHDYFPRFFIWLDEETYAKYGEALRKAYQELPGQFEEYPDTVMTPEAAWRCGVCKTTDFYYRLLGREKAPENMYDWVSLQETRLATVTNGEIFEDGGGDFMAQRQIYLSYFPEDVRKKKLAARLRKMAQTGQYQYARCMARGEYVAAQLALAEFIQNTGSACFLLARQYMPYFKWMHRRMKELPGLSPIADKLEKLTLMSSQQDKWDKTKPEQYRFFLNTADEKVVLIEEIAGMVAEELWRQHLAEGQESYLEPYAAEVESRIEDPVLRKANLV